MARVAVADETAETKPQIDASDPFKKLKSTKLTPLEFWKIVEAIPKEQWGRYKAYLYRIWPRIDRKLSNPNNDTNIGVIQEPFDEQWILNTHGSGKYSIKLNDQTRPQQFQSVCTAHVELRDNDYPPVLNMAELDMGYDGNRSYVEGLRARGLLPGGHMNPNQNQNDASASVLAKALVDMARDRQQPGTDEKAITKAFDLISKGGEKAVELALGRVKEQDPNAFIAMMTAFQKLFPAPANGGNEKLFEVMLKVQADSQSAIATIQKQNTDLLMKLVETRLGANANGNGDGLGAVDKVFGLLEKAKGFLGASVDGGSNGPGGKWGFWADVVKEGAPALRDMFHDGVQAYQAAAMMKQGLWPNAAGVAQTAHTLRQPPRTDPANPSPPGLPAPPATSQPTTPPNAEPSADPRIMVLQQTAAGFMNYVTTGRTGDEFAEWVENGWGSLAYDQLASFGADTILGMLKQSPFWSQLAPIEAKVARFLAEFIDYGKSDGEEVEDTSQAEAEATMAAGVEPATPKRGRK